MIMPQNEILEGRSSGKEWQPGPIKIAKIIFIKFKIHKFKFLITEMFKHVDDWSTASYLDRGNPFFMIIVNPVPGKYSYLL